MDRHVGDRILQARAIRALASGMDWPASIKKSATFDVDALLRRTLTAMRSHANEPWLLLAGFEGFYKFVPDARRQAQDHVQLGAVLSEVESMIRDVMHRYPAEEKLRAWGSRILEMLGVSQS